MHNEVCTMQEIQEMEEEEENPVASAADISRFLPEDIMVNILSRLAVKSILRFRCVCKSWCNLFRSPNFIKMHLNHSVENEKFNLMLIKGGSMYTSVDYYYDPSLPICYEIDEIYYPFKEKDSREVQILGACNGLLCLCIFHPVEKQRTCLWNPSTKEYKEIPMPENDDQFLSHLRDRHGGPAYGFGYDCSIEDYKYVRVVSFYGYVEGDDNIDKLYYGCRIKVYTLGSNSWKCTPVIYYPYNLWFGGVLVNGAIHWRAIPWIRGSDAIVSFDIGAERLAEVPLPEHLDDKMHINVGALGGCLCIFGTACHGASFVVWVMKDYGVRESWTKLFTIVPQTPNRNHYQLRQSFKNGEFLFNFQSQNPDNLADVKGAFILYNPENERVRALNVHGENWGDAMTYVESLVSLKTSMYVDQEHVEEAESIEKAKKLEMRKKINKKRLTWVCRCFS